jgi:GGDEF domain-containing protein
MARRVEQIAAKLLAALLEPIVVDGHPLVATVSLGAAIFPECAGGESDLLKKADMAMYQAKRSGRNRLCIYSETDPAALRPAGRRGPG